VLCALFFVSSLASRPRLIAFDEHHQVWMTPQEALQLEVTNDSFIDITDFPEPKKSNVRVDPIPAKPTQQALVNQLITGIDISNLISTINTLSAYYTRYYRSQTGADASQWLFSQMVSYSAFRPDITVQYFNNSFLVPNVIARIQGSSSETGATRIVVGGHQDCVGSSSTGRSPGADDDASGTATVLETFRVIAQSGFKPARTVEFHLYSGEEGGLLGSQAVASLYSSLGIDVEAMLQLDMTGYGADTDPIGIITDYVDPPLTQFLRLLVSTYTSLTQSDSKCGYGCSDHASWNRYGYRSSFPFEAIFSKSNPNIHSPQDTINFLNMKRAGEFVKIAVGFVVELGQGSF